VDRRRASSRVARRRRRTTGPLHLLKAVLVQALLPAWDAEGLVQHARAPPAVVDGCRLACSVLGLHRRPSTRPSADVQEAGM
jgi:hypothetical protein